MRMCLATWEFRSTYLRGRQQLDPRLFVYQQVIHAADILPVEVLYIPANYSIA